MKRQTNLLLLFILLVSISKSQSWTIGGNTISGPPPNLGTINNQPLNFFTNGIKKGSFSSPAGVFNVVNLSGTGSRFLQANSSGDLIEWAGDPMNPNKVLFQDNTWRSLPFTSDGSNIFTQSDTKLGLGISTPATELDVNGGAKVANSLNVGDGIFLGKETDNDYAVLKYYPAADGKPAVLSFGGGGSSNPNNPSQGSPWHPFNAGHGGGGSDSPDPQPDYTCINGAIPSINLLQNLVCVQKLSTSANPTSLGNINIGHDGNNGFVETQGTNPSNPNAGDLYINGRCNRNLYVFTNGSPFAATTDHVMSVAGRFNVTQNVQMGGGTSTTNFIDPFTQLYVYSSPIVPTGVKIRHGGGGGAAVKAVELSDTDKGLAVWRGTPLVDGSERFSVQGDGKTVINTTSSDALLVSDANTSQVNFQVNSTGATFLGGGISGVANTQLAVAMPIPTYKALGIIDNSNLSSLKDVFSVYGNGYTEININNPNSLPDQVNSVGRVFAIKDKVQNKDIFVVKQNGKAYAREIEISLATSFPDYVFNEGYKLKSLQEVDAFITLNKHLPGFEKGEYYEKNGLNVNDIIIKQQEKIEELTLYIIDLEKRMKSIEKKF